MFCAIFGHTFRPRFSEKLPKGLTFKGKDPAQVAAQIEAAKLKVYEGDVCVSCGMTSNTPLRHYEPTWQTDDQ